MYLYVCVCISICGICGMYVCVCGICMICVVCIYVYVCVYVVHVSMVHMYVVLYKCGVHACAMVCRWKLEDIFEKSVVFYHFVGSFSAHTFTC